MKPEPANLEAARAYLREIRGRVGIILAGLETLKREEARLDGALDELRSLERRLRAGMVSGFPALGMEGGAA